jgi:hypothetical protein
MKSNHSLLYIVLFLALLPASSSYSQKSLDPDSLTSGYTYRIKLFDDYEIIGKLTRIDSAKVILKSDDGFREIKKNDIFFISRTSVPEIWHNIISLKSGLTFLLHSRYENYAKALNGFNIAAEGVFPVKENSGIRFDLQYNRIIMERKYNQMGYFDYGDVNMISFSGDFLIGDFRSKSQFYYYINLGVGLNVTRTGKNTYYSQYSPGSAQIFTTEPSTDIYLFVNAGGTAGLKLSKRLGVFVHTQINTFGSEGGFLILTREMHLPVSLGVSYFF